jgi:hypothetical protein
MKLLGQCCITDISYWSLFIHLFSLSEGLFFVEYRYRLCFDADPDPGPSFYFDADPT